MRQPLRLASLQGQPENLCEVNYEVQAKNLGASPFIWYRMKNLSLVRFASYAVVIGIAYLLRHQIGVIPLHLLSGDEIEALRSEPERRKAERMLVSSPGFTDSKLSGSEVAAIAQNRIRAEGKSLEDFLSPKITLSVVDGKLCWVLYYAATLGPFQFEIRIDDASGVASYEDTTAPM